VFVVVALPPVPVVVLVLDPPAPVEVIDPVGPPPVELLPSLLPHDRDAPSATAKTTIEISRLEKRRKQKERLMTIFSPLSTLWPSWAPMR
jgi:hypothetical protein